jgi:hypothetical protein
MFIRSGRRRGWNCIRKAGQGVETPNIEIIRPVEPTTPMPALEVGRRQVPLIALHYP